MTTIQQDHVVLLVDTPFFENPPAWVTDNFTVTPGGYHDGQASHNKLVIFADGTYLEFFHWYDTPPSPDDENFPMRVWGPKPPGLIDFALTDTTHSAEATAATVNARLSAGPAQDAGLGIRFGPPVAGTRKKADGEIQWKVTRPTFAQGPQTPPAAAFAHGRIDVPFFCHDVTPRAGRVASHDAAKTTHPCGATGIAACEVLVPGHLQAAYAGVYAKILGAAGGGGEHTAAAAAGQGSSPTSTTTTTLDVGVPQGSTRSTVVVRAAETERDLGRMRERGIGLSDLVIAVTADDGTGGGVRRPLGASGIASTIWLETSKTTK